MREYFTLELLTSSVLRHPIAENEKEASPMKVSFRVCMLIPWLMATCSPVTTPSLAPIETSTSLPDPIPVLTATSVPITAIAPTHIPTLVPTPKPIPTSRLIEPPVESRCLLQPEVSLADLDLNPNARLIVTLPDGYSRAEWNLVASDLKPQRISTTATDGQPFPALGSLTMLD